MNELEQKVQLVSEQQISPIPTVIYNKDLLERDVDYAISVNPYECARILQEQGVKDEKIADLKIKLRRKPKRFYNNTMQRAYGTYNSVTNDITLYTDTLWSLVTTCLSYHKEMREGKRKVESIRAEISNFYLMGEELSAQDLMKMPETDAIEELVEIGTEKLDFFLVHELSHVAQHKASLWNIPLPGKKDIVASFAEATALSVIYNATENIPLTVASGVIILYADRTISYHKSPSEKEANTFADSYFDSSHYQSAISIFPKNYTQFTQQYLNSEM